jgi:hypothetical protein
LLASLLQHCLAKTETADFNRDFYFSYALLAVFVFSATLLVLRCTKATAGDNKYNKDKDKFIHANTETIMTRNYARLGAAYKKQ